MPLSPLQSILARLSIAPLDYCPTCEGLGSLYDYVGDRDCSELCPTCRDPDGPAPDLECDSCGRAGEQLLLFRPAEGDGADQLACRSCAALELSLGVGQDGTERQLAEMAALLREHCASQAKERAAIYLALISHRSAP
jgi:hypothetical protein